LTNFDSLTQNNPDSFNIYIINPPENDQQNVFIGENAILIIDSEKSAIQIRDLLTKILLDFRQMHKITEKHFTKKLLSRKRRKSGQEKIDIGPLLEKSIIAPKYFIELTLVVPKATNRQKFQSIGDFIQNHFKPVVKHLENLTSLHFESQMLYLVDFDQEPKKFLDETSGNSWFYTRKQLPHLISGFEQFTTTSLESESKILRFSLYFTPDAKKPLYILDENGENVPGNAFNVMDWGGVVILNEDFSDQTKSDVIITDALDTVFSQLMVSMGFGSISTTEHGKNFKS